MLGQSDVTDYEAGQSEVRFSVDQIDVSAIKPSQLGNAGILSASLRSRDVDVIDVNMVVQVARKGDEFMRAIFNPLE